MDEPIAGPPAFFEWNGIKWYRNARDGYYRDSSGGALLHHAVWVSANGRIPNGIEIHHKDHDRSHNSLDNLTPRSIADHRSYHAKERVKHDPSWAEQVQSEAARARSQKLWANREPRPVVCGHCSTSFESIGMRTKYCSPRCAAAARRRRSRESLGLDANV